MKKAIESVATFLGISYNWTRALLVIISVMLFPIVLTVGGLYMFIYIMFSSSGQKKKSIQSVAAFLGISYDWTIALLVIISLILFPIIIVLYIIVSGFILLHDYGHRHDEDYHNLVRDEYNDKLKEYYNGRKK